MRKNVVVQFFLVFAVLAPAASIPVLNSRGETQWIGISDQQASLIRQARINFLGEDELSALIESHRDKSATGILGLGSAYDSESSLSMGVALDRLGRSSFDGNLVLSYGPYQQGIAAQVFSSFDFVSPTFIHVLPHREFLLFLAQVRPETMRRQLGKPERNFVVVPDLNLDADGGQQSAEHILSDIFLRAHNRTRGLRLLIFEGDNQALAISSSLITAGILTRRAAGPSVSAQYITGLQGEDPNIIPCDACSLLNQSEALLPQARLPRWYGDLNGQTYEPSAPQVFELLARRATKGQILNAEFSLHPWGGNTAVTTSFGEKGVLFLVVYSETPNPTGQLAKIQGRSQLLEMQINGKPVEMRPTELRLPLPGYESLYVASKGIIEVRPGVTVQLTWKYLDREGQTQTTTSMLDIPEPQGDLAPRLQRAREIVTSRVLGQYQREGLVNAGRLVGPTLAEKFIESGDYGGYYQYLGFATDNHVEPVAEERAIPVLRRIQRFLTQRDAYIESHELGPFRLDFPLCSRLLLPKRR